MPELIFRETPNTAVSNDFFYTVAAEVEIRVLSVLCNFDSTGEAAAWSPYLSVNPPGPISDTAIFGQDIKAAANDIVAVTWAPHLRAPQPAFAAGTYFTQTGLPELTLTHGWGLRVSAFLANGSGSSATNTVLSGLAIMVEQIRGSRADLAPGPFMLVPGPGA